MKTGKFIPNDESFSTNTDYEDEIVSKIQNEEWEWLIKSETTPLKENQYTYQHRRGPFKLIDPIRNLFPRGDL